MQIFWLKNEAFVWNVNLFGPWTISLYFCEQSFNFQWLPSNVSSHSNLVCYAHVNPSEVRIPSVLKIAQAGVKPGIFGFSLIFSLKLQCLKPLGYCTPPYSFCLPGWRTHAASEMLDCVGRWTADGCVGCRSRDSNPRPTDFRFHHNSSAENENVVVHCRCVRM